MNKYLLGFFMGMLSLAFFYMAASIYNSEVAFPLSLIPILLLLAGVVVYLAFRFHQQDVQQKVIKITKTENS